MNKIKVRIIGSKLDCERVLSCLPGVINVEKIDRAEERDKNPYSKTFGKAEFVYYVELRKQGK